MFLALLVAVVVYRFEFHEGFPALPEGLALLQIVVLMILPVPVHVLGVILGAVSAFFPSRRKLFPILGIVLNTVFGLFSLFPWLYLMFHSLGRVQ